MNLDQKSIPPFSSENVLLDSTFLFLIVEMSKLTITRSLIAWNSMQKKGRNKGRMSGFQNSQDKKVILREFFGIRIRLTGHLRFIYALNHNIEKQLMLLYKTVILESSCWISKRKRLNMSIGLGRQDRIHPQNKTHLY